MFILEALYLSRSLTAGLFMKKSTDRRSEWLSVQSVRNSVIEYRE